MINLFLFAFVSYGICNILVFGSIFEKWRLFWLKHDEKFLGKLFTCMMCLPFWVGVIISCLVFSPTAVNGFAEGYSSIFLDGALASGLVWLIHTLQEYLEK